MKYEINMEISPVKILLTKEWDLYYFDFLNKYIINKSNIH